MNEVFEIKNLAEINQSDWLVLWKSYQQFYQSNISEEVSDRTWLKLTEQSYSHMYGFAAMRKDLTVMGIVHVIEHDSCWTIAPYAYLQDLYVDQKYRGQGVARALIEQVYEYAMQRHCDRVYWLTHESNHIAQQLYDKVAKKTGFIQYRM